MKVLVTAKLNADTDLSVKGSHWLIDITNEGAHLLQTTYE